MVKSKVGKYRFSEPGKAEFLMLSLALRRLSKAMEESEVKTKLPDDSEDIFDNVDEFYQRLTKKTFKDMKDIEEAIRNGKLEGEWDIQPIEKPGIKGHIARGHFQSGDKAEPKILKLPEKIQEEMREPLSDVFEDKDNVKLYVELPGVEQKDIRVSVLTAEAEINDYY